MKRLTSLAAGIVILALLAGAASACGGGDDSGDDGDNGGAPTTAATAPSNNGDDADNGDNGDSEDGPLTLIGKNTLWDKTELEAEPGEVTINVDNQDAGLVHNLHVYKGSDATGEDKGMTDLEAGPTQQTLTFTADAGEYFYVCDAHPATMAGTLTVGD